MSTLPLKIGVAGLGRGFMLMLPTFRRDSRIALVAACDPRPAARTQFEQDFGGRSYAAFEALAMDPDVDLIYIASPHQLHRAQVEVAVATGKHVMVEKPMALGLDDCTAMIEAARRAGVVLMVGHSHSFDAPYLKTRELVASGAYGRLRMVTALNFTDFLYRPRRPEELDTSRGGGVIFSQAAHQIDVVRLIGGGRLSLLSAASAIFDPARPTESAYTAQLVFEDGAFASLTYSGAGHFDSDEWLGWRGELGQVRDPAAYGTARAALARIGSPEAEAALKETRTYGAAPTPADAAPEAHNHFGFVLASCERADLRPMADGVSIYADGERTFVPLPAGDVPRGTLVDEMIAAVIEGKPALHSGEWGRATLEACLAIIDSARLGQQVKLSHQVGLPAGY